MDLLKLRYFYEVAQVQHVTRAAENISIAQPALTQAIKALERELGVPLLEKRGRNIALTEYGVYLKNRLDNLLPELDALPGELESLKQQSRHTIRLNIQAASNFVIDAIVRYRQLHPDVIFDFEQNVRRLDCDLSVSTNGVEDLPQKRPYRRRCIKEERIYLAVPKNSAYAEMEAIDLSQVRNESFVMLSASRLFGVVCNKFCAAVGFVPKVIFESDSPAAVQNIVGTGVGVAFWPEYSWGAVKNDDIALLPITNPVCQRELIIELYDRPVHSAYAEDFYDFLLEQYQPEPRKNAP